MNQPVNISDLVARAAGGKGVVLSRRELRPYQGLDIGSFKAMMRDLGRHEDKCLGMESGAILGEQSRDDLGDAPAWIDAGAVYEALVDFEREEKSLDFVFCLDPWSAQLLSGHGEIAAGACWVVVSDLHQRKGRGQRDYWRQLSDWYEKLPYHAILSREDWERALAEERNASGSVSGQVPPYQKFGSWRWYRILAAGDAPPVLLIHYSGSLIHLRVCLDSLAQLEGGSRPLRCIVVASRGIDDVRSYLKWADLAYRNLRISAMRASGEGEGWESELSAVLGVAGNASVILMHDHVILPKDFVQSLTEKTPSCFSSVTLGAETTARVLTGMLDASAGYEALLVNHSGERTPRVECVRAIPAKMWRVGGPDPATRLVALARESGNWSELPPASILELADLP